MKSNIIGTNVDVLILVALKDELDALISINTYATEGSRWAEPDEVGHYWIRDFNNARGGRFRIAAARATDMGGEAIIALGSPLVEKLQPRYLAMCGICATSSDAINLGDVIVADKVFRYDVGKIFENNGNEEFLAEITTYNLSDNWKRAAQDAAKGTPDWHEDLGIAKPISFGFQDHWVCWAIAEFKSGKQLNPLDRTTERQAVCPDREWGVALDRLRREGKIHKSNLTLTEKGRQSIERDRQKYPDGFPSDDAIRIHVSPIATGNNVIQREGADNRGRIFEIISRSERKFLGIDMEASAVGYLSYVTERPCIVAKGVQDYANQTKDDRYRPYAARASARFLIEFFHHQLAIVKQKPPSRDFGLGPRPIPPLTPVEAAVLNGNIEILKRLLGSAAPEDLSHPLLLAISWGYEKIAELLVAHGADVNAKRDADGKTALILAVDRRFYGLSQTLLDQGAEPNVRDAWGSSPLSLAVGHNDEELVSLLTTYGAENHAATLYPRTGLLLVNGEIHSFLSNYDPSKQQPVNPSCMAIVQIGEPRVIELPSPSTEGMCVRFSCSFAAPQDAIIREANICVKTNYVDGIPATIIGAELLDRTHTKTGDSIRYYTESGTGTNLVKCQLIGSPDWNLEGSHLFEFWVAHDRPLELRCVITVEAQPSCGNKGIKEKEFKI